MPAHPTIPCPKCSRPLPADGEIACGGATIATYCCPECVTRRKFMGEMMELPLMFIVGPDGRAYDPADPDGAIDLTEYE